MDIKINKTKIFYILLLVIWLQPAVLSESYLPYSSYLFLGLQAVTGFVFIVKNKVKMSAKPETVFFMLFMICGFIGMIFVTGVGFLNLCKYIFYIVTLIGIYFFFLRSSREKLCEFFQAVKLLWVISIILTLLIGTTISENAEYGTQVFFWGSEAVTTQAFMMFISLTFFGDLKFEGKIRRSTWICYVLSLLFAVINGSGQGTTMIGLFALLYLINKFCRKDFWKIVSPVWFVVIVAVLNYIVITLRFQNYEIFVDYITQVLSKDLTLTGRDQIFSGSLELFFEHPLFGYGYGNTIVFDTLGKIWKAFNTAHNSMLQLMLDYGAIGTIMFALMIYFGLKTMKKSEDKSIEELYFSLLAMFVGGLVNMIIPTNYFWMVFITALAIVHKEENKEIVVKNIRRIQSVSSLSYKFPKKAEDD